MYIYASVGKCLFENLREGEQRTISPIKRYPCSMVGGSQTWGEDSLRLGGGIPEVGGWAGAPTGWGGEERLLELEGEGGFWEAWLPDVKVGLQGVGRASSGWRAPKTSPRGSFPEMKGRGGRSKSGCKLLHLFLKK